MKPRSLVWFALGACLAEAQTLERFAPLVRTNETFFAGAWAASASEPAASFVQGAAEYDIQGVTDVRSGFVDIYAPASGPLFSIGSAAAIELTGKVLAANQAASFRVFLVDAAGTAATATFRTADFSTTDFSTIGSALAAPAGFDPNAIERIRISGDAVGGTSVFAFAFQQLAAAPRAGGDGALSNFSLRARVGSGSDVLIVGFVVSGSAATPVLVRAVGPGLAPFGIAGVAADPQVTLFSGSTAIAVNDNWVADAPMAAATVKAGAFQLTSGSRDAAISTSIAPGLYTAQARSVGGTSGMALVELYNVDPGPAFPRQRFINVSALATLGPGNSQLLAGFVVTGHSAKRLLIRAAGPALGTVGVPSGFVADPQLTLWRVGTSQVVRENDNWENGTDRRELVTAMATGGAFPFAAGSRDAAMVVTLTPGVYTAIAASRGDSAGIVLIEIYELP